jgi:hypothetical protein
MHMPAGERCRLYVRCRTTARVTSAIAYIGAARLKHRRSRTIATRDNRASAWGRADSCFHEAAGV